MTPAQIRQLVQETPALLAFLGTDASTSNIEGLAAAISLNRTKITSHFASERGVLDRYPGGPVAADALLSKLEAFTNAGHQLSGVVRRAVKFLGTPEGIDLGSNGVQGMLAALTPDLLTVAERDGLRAMATVPDPVSAADVQAALFNDDGSRKV